MLLWYMFYWYCMYRIWTCLVSTSEKAQMVCSFVHGILVFIYTSKFDVERLICFSSAYFLSDILHEILKAHNKSYIFIAHHLAVLVIYTFVFFHTRDYDAMFMDTLFWAEITNPLQQIWSMLRLNAEIHGTSLTPQVCLEIKRRVLAKSKVYTACFTLYMSMFCFARLYAIPMIYYKLLWQTEIDWKPCGTKIAAAAYTLLIIGGCYWAMRTVRAYFRWIMYISKRRD